MKSVFLVFATLVLHLSQAQEIKFGFKGGANFSTLQGDDFKADNLLSYHAGVLVEFNLLENFSIQPELLYSSQGTKINSDDLELNYVSMPVLAKFYLTSKKLSLEVGPQFSFLLSESVPEQFRTESFDLAAAGGLGYNISQTFFMQLRYLAGLTEASKDTTITNRTIQLSVGLRF